MGVKITLHDMIHLQLCLNNGALCTMFVLQSHFKKLQKPDDEIVGIQQTFFSGLVVYCRFCIHLIVTSGFINSQKLVYVT